MIDYDNERCKTIKQRFKIFIKWLLEALRKFWTEIRKNEIIEGLLITAIIMPLLVCLIRLFLDGFIIFKGPYDSNWLSFFGSYLGGILGGVATLIAVVRTIDSNKEEAERNKNEQAQKENAKKQEEIEKSVLIIYLDFEYALKNVEKFLSMFWEKRKAINTDIEIPYDDLKCDEDFIIYKECLIALDQLYFDNDFVHSVAKLRNSSLGGEMIWNISEIYGHLSNIKRSMEVSDRIVYRIAFRSMNNLIEIKNNDLLTDSNCNNFDRSDKCKKTINTLEGLAIKKKDSEPVNENKHN